MEAMPYAGLEPLITAVKKWFVKKRSPNSDLSLNHRHGVIKDFIIPHRIKIRSWSDISAVYEGSVKSGFFSLMIQDCDGVKQVYKDSNSIDIKILDSGEHVETGKLNFTNLSYESKWKFRPDPPLKAGRGKAIVGMFGDRDAIPLDFQEKDIILY